MQNDRITGVSPHHVWCGWDYSFLNCPTSRVKSGMITANRPLGYNAIYFKIKKYTLVKRDIVSLCSVFTGGGGGSAAQGSGSLTPLLCALLPTCHTKLRVNGEGEWKEVPSLGDRARGHYNIATDGPRSSPNPSTARHINIANKINLYLKFHLLRAWTLCATLTQLAAMILCESTEH